MSDEENPKNEAVESSATSGELDDLNPDMLESPIDLNVANMRVKTLKSLIWCHYHVPPKKMKLTNTGKTVVLSAKWNQERPFIAGGPLSSRYVFSQIHFHWGSNDMVGSEHSVDGESLPMELHAVHFKSDYLSQEVAMRENDGISILVFFFKLQTVENPKVDAIVKALPFVKQPHASTRMEPWSMTNLLRPFNDDYFLYRGSISTRNYSHSVLWLISRQPIGISIEQVAEFRSLKATNVDQTVRDPRILHETGNRTIYHVNPSGSAYASLLPISWRLTTSESACEVASICDERDTQIVRIAEDRTGAEETSPES